MGKEKAMVWKDSIMKRYLWSDICGNDEAFHIFRARCQGTTKVLTHSQDFPELFWIEEGYPLHHVNDHSVPLKPGNLIFIRSTDCHTMTADPRTTFVMVNVAVPPTTLAFLRTRYFEHENRWFWKKGPEPDTVHLDRERLSWLARWVSRLDSSGRSKLEIEIFLLELFRELKDAPTSREADGGPEWLQDALRHITEPEILTGGTLALARKAGRTPQHLNATIKKIHGITATMSINEARMGVAAHDLRTSTKKIMEICFDCGFQNLAHFYALFRKRFGTTPRLYRQRHHAIVR